MAAGSLRKHIPREPCPGDRLFARRLVSRDALPVSVPPSLTGHPPRAPFPPPSQSLLLSLIGYPQTWPGANHNENLCNRPPISTPHPRGPPRPTPAQEKKKTRRCGAIASLERGIRSDRFPFHRGTARTGGEVEHDPQECPDLVCLAFFASLTTDLTCFRFQNKRQQRRNLLRQSASVRGQASGNPSGAHHGGSSRSLPAQGNVSTVPMPLHQPGSVSSNPHQTTYSPSPTDTAYFPLSRPLQPQQGTSTHYRSPSRNFDDFHDGGSSRRNRV